MVYYKEFIPILYSTYCFWFKSGTNVCRCLQEPTVEIGHGKKQCKLDDGETTKISVSLSLSGS